MTRIAPLVALIALALASGCSGAYPVHGATALEAAYDLREDGASFGSARLTAAAVEDREMVNGERAVVAVDLLLQNDGDADFRTGERELELLYVQTTTARVDGEATLPVTWKVLDASDGAVRVEASYALPRGIRAWEVTHFALRWAVVRDGERFGDVTTFMVTAPGAVPVASAYVSPLLGASQTEIYSGYAGPAAGFLPDSGVYVAPPPGAPVPVAAPTPSWHFPAQPSVSHDHAPAQPSVGRHR